MPTVFLTGANRGLGLEFTHRYIQRGWKVFAVARNSSPELEALGENPMLHLIRGEVLDEKFLQRLPGLLQGETLDVLINNAGIMGTCSFAGTGRLMQGLADFNRDEWREVFELNVLTPMQITSLLLPLVRDGGTLITLSSIMGSIERNSFAGWYAYRCSKSAVNMMMKCMSLEVEARGIISVALHPGWVKTDMGGSSADLEIDESLDGMMRVIDRLKATDSGKFIAWDGSELPY